MVAVLQKKRINPQRPLYRVREMEIKREFLYEDQQALVILTDDPQTASKYKKQGICCVGICSDDLFFDGASFVVSAPEDADIHLLQLAWCRFNRVPYVIFRTEDIFCRESILADYDELYALTRGEKGVHFPEKDVFSAYIENAYDFWGYGIWTVLAKLGTNWEIVGWIGIDPGQEPETASDELVQYYYGDACQASAPELGFVIRKDLRRRGIAKRVCSQIIEYASENLGIENLVIRTGKDNEAAKALASSLGFKEKLD